MSHLAVDLFKNRTSNGVSGQEPKYFEFVCLTLKVPTKLLETWI